MLNNNSTLDEINADSANLPYQYLIEKEIENAKRNIKKYGLEEVNKKNTTNYTQITTNIIKMQESSCPKKRKYALNNDSRSSDITDLVMEGLMFTIRQGKDAVAVIEQKTKLEVDEVLENSEKVETKKGEKCLRNSSLLGLENLITMIELPKKNESENKYQNVINQEYTLKSKSINKHIFNNIKYSLTNNKINEQNIASEVEHKKWNTCNNSILASTSFSYNDNSLDITNKYCYTETYDDYKCKENTNFIVNKNLKYKEEKDEEEEDIIPEALQDVIFQSSDLSLKLDKCEDKLQLMSNKDLLMDDIDNEELKSEIGKNEFNFHFNKNPHSKIYLKDDPNYNSSVNSVLNETQKLCNNTIYESCKDTRKLNVPVIISNQIITLDQIPLPLQKILKNRLSMKQNCLNNENKINKDNIESCNIQCQVKNNVSNIEVENQSANSNILTLSKHYQKSIKDNKEVYDKNTLSPILKKEMKEIKYSDIAKDNVKKELQEQKNCINKTKLPLLKIKDITQEFYKDLSYLQKKKNLTNQKYFRSRRKSLILNNTHNDEMHIQMVKFFQDITRGAKVVIRRININKYS